MKGLKLKVFLIFWSFCAVIGLGLLLRRSYPPRKYLVRVAGTEFPTPQIRKKQFSSVRTQSPAQVRQNQFSWARTRPPALVYDILPERIQRRVRKFLLFFGSGKSGHSIVGSLLDAHRHIVISHEFHLFRNWNQVKGDTKRRWAGDLYNKLYWKSKDDSFGIRKASSKGYSLKVEGLWQGRYDSFISVIGDKSGGSTRQEYVRNKELFKKNLHSLSLFLEIPIVFIHVVRNPFDHVASRVLYTHVGDIAAVSTFKKQLKGKFKDDELVLKVTKEMLSFYELERELVDLIKPENILEVHLSDLVSSPKRTLVAILKFLEVPANSKYLQVCTAKVFSSASRSRDYIQWPEEAQDLLNDAIVKYQFLRRYNFETD